MALFIATFLSVLFFMKADIVVPVNKGQLFQKVIKGSDFFNNVNSVKLSVSPENSPDLPKWLRFEQKDPTSDGVLYGTPDDNAYTTGLLVIALNKNTYDTGFRRMIIAVNGKTPNITHPFEMMIKNKDWNDLLNNNDHFLKVVRTIWSSAQYLSSVERAINRDGFSVSPYKKEGVYVAIGGKSKLPRELLLLKDNCQSVVNSSAHAYFLKNGYDIDWCKLKNLNDPDTHVFPFDRNSHFFPLQFSTTKFDPSREDLTLDIIYVFIAVFIGLVLIIILTILMCFNREGLDQRNKLTPKEQLLHHTALRRAGAQLRNMPGKDEGNKGFPYGKLDDDSRSGTLSSKQANNEKDMSPPPYKYGNDRVERQDSKF